MPLSPGRSMGSPDLAFQVEAFCALVEHDNWIFRLSKRRYFRSPDFLARLKGSIKVVTELVRIAVSIAEFFGIEIMELIEETKCSQALHHEGCLSRARWTN